MEIKVNAEGEVVINVVNGETDRAIDLIRALQGEARGKKINERRSESMKLAAQKVDTGLGSGKLNQIQYRTWEYLCENDCSDGIHISGVARAFGVPNTTANSRVLVLEKLGYAKRVRKGYYRALTPENG